MITKSFIYLLLVLPNFVFSQRYISKKNEISFFSGAVLEDITATNKKSTSAIDVSTWKIAFSVPIKHFEFEKSLMKEHFNEQYMETEKYPKATFLGHIEVHNESMKGKQPAKAKGVLSIHGIEHEIETEGWITIGKNNIVIESKFLVKLEDYKIKIPKVVWQNIAEEIEVKIYFEYKPYEK